MKFTTVRLTRLSYTNFRVNEIVGVTLINLAWKLDVVTEFERDMIIRLFD